MGPEGTRFRVRCRHLPGVRDTAAALEEEGTVQEDQGMKDRNWANIWLFGSFACLACGLDSRLTHGF